MGLFKKSDSVQKGAIKIDAERRKIAERQSWEGYPVVYAGTRGTVFLRNIKQIKMGFSIAN